MCVEVVRVNSYGGVIVFKTPRERLKRRVPEAEAMALLLCDIDGY
jgi:hypothetical protein